LAKKWGCIVQCDNRAKCVDDCCGGFC